VLRALGICFVCAFATRELADLRGGRLVTVPETPEHGRLASERVKAITGGEFHHPLFVESP
jgi:phage/plasmid-associated DNA primase